MKPRVLVLRAAGINCEVETAFAFERYGAAAETLHVNRVLAKPATLDGFDALAIPGGFSYGDDISAGKVLALELLKLRDGILGLIDRGGLVLGICNGFQALVKTGILPGIAARIGVQEVTLADNESNKYEDRWVHLVAESPHCVFVKQGERLHVPLAHGEGKYVPKDDATHRAIVQRGQVAFRYVSESGSRDVGYPENPNGAIDGVAGLVDSTGRVLGLMPHPERALFAVHHPAHSAWSGAGASTGAGAMPDEDEGEGARIFKNAVEHLKS